MFHLPKKSLLFTMIIGRRIANYSYTS
jgi:hypothetical protein